MPSLFSLIIYPVIQYPLVLCNFLGEPSYSFLQWLDQCTLPTVVHTGFFLLFLFFPFLPSNGHLKNENILSYLELVLHIKLYFKAVIMKIVWDWHGNMYVGRWNGRESLELNPYTYDPLVFDKCVKKRITSTISSITVQKTVYPQSKE